MRISRSSSAGARGRSSTSRSDRNSGRRATNGQNPLPLSEHDATLWRVAVAPRREEAPRSSGLSDAGPHGHAPSPRGPVQDRRHARLVLQLLEGTCMPEVGGGSVQLLDVDPELARELDPRRAREAAQRLYARAIDIPRGRWIPNAGPLEGTRPIGLLILDGAARARGHRRRPPVGRAARSRRPAARLGRRRQRGAAPAHDRVERAHRDARRHHRPRVRGARRAVAGGLRRPDRPRRPPRRAARRDAGDRAPDARRRPPARAAVVPRRALGPGRPGRRARVAAPLAPHARGHGRRAPARRSRPRSAS